MVSMALIRADILEYLRKELEGEQVYKSIKSRVNSKVRAVLKLRIREGVRGWFSGGSVSVQKH